MDIGYHYYNISGSDCVTVSATQPWATNGATAGTFTLTRQSTTGNLTVYYGLSGSAVNGVDYTSLPGSATIPSGSYTKEISVSPPSVGHPEPRKTVILTLQQGSAYKVCSPSSALVNIVDSQSFGSKTVVSNLTGPIGIGYDPSEDSLIVSVNYGTGNPYNFVRIDSSGFVHQDWGNISNLLDEVKIAVARTGGDYFNIGDTFYGTGAKGQIGYMSGDASSVITNWLDLSGADTDILRGGLYIDESGLFNGDLIVVSGAGNGLGGDIWRVDGHKKATHVVDLGVDLEGVTTTQNDPAKYGPLAGKILAGEETTSYPGIYAVDAGGSSNKWRIRALVDNFLVYVLNPEDLVLVTAGQSLFCVSEQSGAIIEVPQSALIGFQGDILVTDEDLGLFVVHWNGYDFETRQVLPSGGKYEQATFAPMDLSN